MPWACLRSKPRAEALAAASLKQRGYRVFLPLHRTRRTDELRPLFARYLFVEHDANTPWTPIAYAPGVEQLLKSSTGLRYARDADINTLQATEAARCEPMPTKGDWSPGTPCSIASGPLAGIDAVVLEHHSTSHARIGLLILGGMRRITVPFDQLQGR